jgi:hypothetical protein
MKKVKKLWMPLLLGVLLMSTLVGVAGARPNARPEASPALVDYMFSAKHCNPPSDQTQWRSTATSIMCNNPAGSCGFNCPIKPPHQGVIRVQRLAMYAYDNSAGYVCIWLRHMYPKTATFVDRLTNQCTSDNAADPQTYAYNPANFKVSPLQDLIVWVSMANTFAELYGFKLKYEPL